MITQYYLHTNLDVICISIFSQLSTQCYIKMPHLPLFDLFISHKKYSTVHGRGTGDTVPAVLLFTQKSHPPQRFPVPLK